MNGGTRKRERPNERLKTKITTQGDQEWSNMMDFFKSNPAALMDALPTPPGSDHGGSPAKSIRGKGMDFSIKRTTKKFDDTTSQASARSARSNRSNLSYRSGISNRSFQKKNFVF